MEYFTPGISRYRLLGDSHGRNGFDVLDVRQRRIIDIYNSPVHARSDFHFLKVEPVPIQVNRCAGYGRSTEQVVASDIVDRVTGNVIDFHRQGDSPGVRRGYYNPLNGDYRPPIFFHEHYLFGLALFSGFHHLDGNVLANVDLPLGGSRRVGKGLDDLYGLEFNRDLPVF